MKFESSVDVSYYEIIVSAANNEAPDTLFSLDEIIESLMFSVAKKQCRRPYDNNSRVVSIKQICVDDDNDVVILLLSSSDTRKVNPAFENIQTGAVRTEKKGKDEGLGESVHIAIDLRPYNLINKHLCLIEHVVGFGKTQLQSFFDVESRDVCGKRDFKNTEGTAKASGPAVEFKVIDDTITGHSGDGGTINSVTLMSHSVEGDGFDSEQWLKPLKQERHFKIDKGTPVSAFMRWASDVITKYHKYTSLKVNYSTADGRTRSALSQEREDSFDFAFGRIEPVELSNKIDSAALVAIHEELKCKMVNMLIKERN